MCFTTRTAALFTNNAKYATKFGAFAARYMSNKAEIVIKCVIEFPDGHKAAYTSSTTDPSANKLTIPVMQMLTESVGKALNGNGPQKSIPWAEEFELDMSGLSSETSEGGGLE
jgi:hypothetical protein